MWTIFFEVFISFVTIFFCFMFWFFDHEACGILAPWSSFEPEFPALEGKVLITGLCLNNKDLITGSPKCLTLLKRNWEQALIWEEGRQWRFLGYSVWRKGVLLMARGREWRILGLGLQWLTLRGRTVECRVDHHWDFTQPLMPGLISGNVSSILIVQLLKSVIWRW